VRKLIGFVGLVGVLSVIPRTSLAQTNGGGDADGSRILLDVNFGGLDASLGSDRIFRAFFIASGEVASAETTYRKPSRDFSALLDLGAGYMFASRAGVGVTVARTSQESAIRLQASIPDPIFWNVPSTAIDESLLERREVATHIFLAYVPVRTHRIHVRLTGGPTLFAYSADMVSGFSYQHAPGATDTRSPVTITTVSTERTTSLAGGFHLGGEATWFVTHAVGVAAGIRFSRGTATIDVEPFSKVSQQVRVGQTRGYMGLRFRFGR
jgi:hypothetical protein